MSDEFDEHVKVTADTCPLWSCTSTEAHCHIISDAMPQGDHPSYEQLQKALSDLARAECLDEHGLERGDDPCHDFGECPYCHPHDFAASALGGERPSKPRPTINELIKRRDDMGQGYLRLLVQDDGDVIVEVLTRSPFSSCPPSYQVEFCTPGTGGGKSPRTVEALRALAVAMELDNKEKAV